MAQNTIKLAFYGMPGPELEGIGAGGGLYPGVAVERAAGNTYAVNGTLYGFCSKTILVENPYVVPEASTLPIGALYSAGDRVYMVQARPGDVMLMWLIDGETASEGDYLGIIADGMLGPMTGITANAGAIMGVALEAASGGERIKVQIV